MAAFHPWLISHHYDVNITLGENMCHHVLGYLNAPMPKVHQVVSHLGREGLL